MFTNSKREHRLGMNALLISELNFKTIIVDHDKGIENMEIDEGDTRDVVIEDKDSIEGVIMDEGARENAKIKRVIGEVTRKRAKVDGTEVIVVKDDAVRKGLTKERELMMVLERKG